MKNLFLLSVFIGCIFTILISINQKTLSMPNPWTNCKSDMSCAIEKAGFNFPISVKDYNVRAMKDMIEITFMLDKKRVITIRKTEKYDGRGDISGVYENYPTNKTITLKNGVLFRVRGNENKYYVANFASETGYYSAFCPAGMKYHDIEILYKLIEQAEAPRQNFEEKNSYSIEKLRELRTVDGIVEPVYTQNCFPRTLAKKGVTLECFERANLGDDTICSASQVKMIKEYYKKGWVTDPLNNGSGQYCAD